MLRVSSAPVPGSLLQPPLQHFHSIIIGSHVMRTLPPFSGNINRKRGVTRWKN
jgi:hypothetical protein